MWKVTRVWWDAPEAPWMWWEWITPIEWWRFHEGALFVYFGWRWSGRVVLVLRKGK